MKRPLQYWQKIYLASLALFLGGLCAGFFAVLNISCRQSFAARTGVLLAGQHNLAVTLANDMAVVMASRPEALDLLWQETGRAARSEGLALAVWRGGAPRYSLLAMNDLPELETLQPGQRSWQVRLVEGRHLFFATTALAGDLTGYAVTVQADMEDFYTEWRRTGAVFLSLGSAVGAAFAAGLYLVLRRMNRPLQALTETARALAAGDYARRAAAPGAPPRRDEVGELARVLDQLAGRVQAQLRQLAEEAAAKQRLVDDLSHEMRTPLTAIGGYAEYLQLADVQGEERQEALQTIRHESRRLLNLSDQLVRLAVLRQEPLETARLDPAALLRRAAATARPKAESQGVSVQLRPLPGALPAIRGGRGAAGKPAGQPVRQRHQGLRRRRPGDPVGRRKPGGRLHPGGGGRWPGDGRRHPAQGRPALLPGGQGPLPGRGRGRAGGGALPQHRRRPRGRAAVRKRAGGGHHRPGGFPAGRGIPPGVPRCVYNLATSR